MADDKSQLKPRHFEDQLEDEEVLLVFRKHPVVMRLGLVLASVGLLIGPLYTLVLTYVHPNNPPSISFFFGSLLASLVLAGLLFFPSWLGWYYSVFITTNQRLIQITQKGFFSRSVVDLGLPQIQMVNYEVAGLQETLLGFGTITLQTYLGELVIHDVHHPAKIQKKLLTILRENGVSATTFPAKDSNDDET